MYRPDLAIVFSSTKAVSDKHHVRENRGEAQDQYTCLISLLNRSGLKAVGKRGRKAGDVLILIRCLGSRLRQLARRERESDFVYGLPVHDLKSMSEETELRYLTPANRIRLVYSYITSHPEEGGLDITPSCAKWSRVQSILALHDPSFDTGWIKSLTRGRGESMHLNKVKDHYGEAVALYFAFLSTYTNSLTIISVIGTVWYLFKFEPYSPYYSVLLLIWSTFFVEYWNICERKLAVRWSTKGVFQVEQRKYHAVKKEKHGSWWRSDTKKLLRVVASLGMLFAFMLILAVLLTVIFILEAFIPILYTGPGSQFIQLVPTIVFAASVPTLLEVYHSYAIHVTTLEHHKDNSTYDSSFTTQRFALSTLVSYLGLALSAFVYVPFGAEVLGVVHIFLYGTAPAQKFLNSSSDVFWEQDVTKATTKLDTRRLYDQMFTSTVTAQIMNAFEEVGWPFVSRAWQSFKGGDWTTPFKGFHYGHESASKMKLGKKEGGEDEDEFLERVRNEVALGVEYDVFEDYSEMVTQFGYVAMWSSIWPLASVMALANNWLESRSDAFKIMVHVRRPIPIRTDSIGPWLGCLRSVTWAAALSNTILVRLFNHRFSLSTHSTTEERMALLIWALLASLGASHGYLLLQHVVKLLVERVFWRDSPEDLEVTNVERKVKDVCLIALKDGNEDHQHQAVVDEGDEEEDVGDFWKLDEGVDELRRDVKDA